MQLLAGAPFFLMLKSKIIKFFALLFIISALDYSLSNLFFKSKSFWKYEKLTDFYWRIPSKEYHHDLLPNIDVLEEGSDLVVSTWDVLSGNVNLEDDIVLYDDGGYFSGLKAAELISEKSKNFEVITPERFFARDIGGMNFVPYGRNLYEKNVKISINKRISKVFKKGNRLGIKIISDYSDGLNEDDCTILVYK